MLEQGLPSQPSLAEQSCNMAYCNKTTLPSCNRLLERKWDERKLQAHQQKLRSMKSSLDNKAPPDFAHIRQNQRKAQIQKEQKSSIDHHNQLLLERMQQIMRTTGRVDHRNLDWQPKRSPNFVKKQHEMDRLMKENQALLRRIQGARPQYSTKTWESDFKHHQSLSRNLSLLPQIPQHHSSRRTRTLPADMRIGLKTTQLPPLPPLPRKHSKELPEAPPARSHTGSEIQEEIDIELPAAELKATTTLS